jgi:hypothetical protein
MSYNINLTNGTTLVPGGLSDGSIDISHSSLTLIGRNYAGYGQFLNENFVSLLENFANGTGPSNPLKGQLWWDTTNNILRVWSGTTWKISTGATASNHNNPPGDLSSLGGDLWFDTTNGQLNVYSGTSWIVVGPTQTPATGNTGTLPALVTDTSGSTHIVIQFTISGTIYAILSKDTFSSALTGFATIKAGLNFTTLGTSLVLNTQDINATASTIVQRDGAGSINVNGLNAATINAAGSVTATTFSGRLTGNVIGNVSATVISASTISTQGINASSGYTGTILTASQPNITGLGNVVNLQTNGTTSFTGLARYNGSEIATLNNIPSNFSSINATPIGNITPSTGAFTSLTSGNARLTGGYTDNVAIGANTAATGKFTTLTTTSLEITGTTATINGAQIATLGGGGTFTSIQNTPIGNATPSTGAFTTLAVGTSLLPTANISVNIGSASNWFNNIYGTAIHAQYADLAERFHADAIYAPGTVVEMGGANEITQVVEELSNKVFGVISTNAAYLMNSGAGTNETHPPVAMSGRVPVRAVGLITKGDRLVSAGNGLARAGTQEELTPWNVIGRSLVNKTDSAESLIEAIVKINS